MPQMQHRMNFTNPAWVYLTGIDTLETVTFSGDTWVYAGSRALGGITGFAVADGSAATVLGSWAMPGRGSSFLLEDIAWIDLNGQARLIVTETTSAQGDGALSSFALRDGTTLDLVDTIGAKDGLWASGLSALAAVSAFGQTDAVVAATLSSSLTLIRVNPMGVMFVADHRIDDLTTRFSRLTDVAGFEIGARGFVVAGGADDGVILFEIMPDGQLLHLQAIAQAAGQTLANVTTLTTATTPTEVQIFVAGAGQYGVTQLVVPVAAVAAPQIGGAGAEVFVGGPRDDLIWGWAGNDMLSGGDGADILMGG